MNEDSKPSTPQPTVVLAPSQSLDAFLPPEMASRAESIGVKKATMGPRNTFALAVLAGAFIALGAIFATTVTTGAAGHMSYGMTKLAGGLVFCLGLILVVVAGAELFTGNNLIIMAWADGGVSTRKLLRNWSIVYVGNFVGAIATAVLVFVARQHTFGGGAVGLNMLNIAEGKTGLGFGQAIALGILCNGLVCLAVWLCYSARTTTDKILAILFPVTAFVAAGYEHSIANMFFIPMGLFVKGWAGPEFWASISKLPADFPNITWSNFFIVNLLPVTIGNIIGGSLMVGLAYWFIYIRKGMVSATSAKAAVGAEE
jgi:formate transporter